MVTSVGLLTLVTAFLVGGASLLGLPLGLPPGEVDDALARTPPEGCVVYVEWSGRAPGRAGAPGLDGLVADPEIVAFLETVDRALRGSIQQNIPDDQQRERLLAGMGLTTTLLNRPGCMFVSFRSDDLPLREGFPNFALLLGRLQAGLVIHAGEQADAFQQQATRLLSAAAIQVPDRLERFVLPVPAPGGGLTLHRAGDRFLGVYGQGTLDAVLSGLAGERPGLLANERIRTALEEVALERPARRVWVDMAALVRAADRIAGDQVMLAETLSLLGLDGVLHYAACDGVDPRTGQLVSRCRLHTDGRLAGLMTVLAGRPLTVEDFRHIPADADLVIAKSVPVGRVLQAVRTIVASADANLGEQFDAGVQAFEAELGLTLDKDVWPAFGDVWTLYDSPSHGGVLLTAPVLALEVRDPQKASAVFTQMMQALQRELAEKQVRGPRRGGALAQQKFLDRTIYYVNIIGDDDAPFAPAFCLTPTHLLVALHPQPLKAHLRFIESDEPRLSTHLAADTPVRTRKLIYFGRVESAAAGRSVMAVAPFLAQLIASGLQREQIDIDAFAFPSARAILPYLSESSGWIEVGDHGLTCGTVHGVPIPGLAGSLFLLLPLRVYERIEAPPPALR